MTKLPDWAKARIWEGLASEVQHDTDNLMSSCDVLQPINQYILDTIVPHLHAQAARIRRGAMKRKKKTKKARKAKP